MRAKFYVNGKYIRTVETGKCFAREFWRHASAGDRVLLVDEKKSHIKKRGNQKND